LEALGIFGVEEELARVRLGEALAERVHVSVWRGGRGGPL
jgi:hypothetical protein